MGRSATSRVLKNLANVIASDRRERGNLIFLVRNPRLLRRFAPRNDKSRLFQHPASRADDYIKKSYPPYLIKYLDSLPKIGEVGMGIYG